MQEDQVNKPSIIKRLFKLRTWQLALIFLLLVALSATFLRLNNVGMDDRREAVLQADQNRDREAVKLRLAELQAYVSSHMNTSLGIGVSLDNIMKEDQEKLFSSQNENIYKQADQNCASERASGSYPIYHKCMLNYLSSIPEGQVVSKSLFSSDKVQQIYTHNFLSPIWSPDFAGWFTLLSLIVLIAIFIRVISFFYMHFLLKKYRNQI